MDEKLTTKAKPYSKPASKQQEKTRKLFQKKNKVLEQHKVTETLQSEIDAISLSNDSALSIKPAENEQGPSVLDQSGISLINLLK